MIKIDILEYLNKLVLSTLADNYINLEEYENIVTFSHRKDLGDFQCNIAFLILKSKNYGNDLNEITKKIAELLSKSNDIKSINIIGGFINFSLSEIFLVKYAETLLNSKFYTPDDQNANETVIIDFGGPNIAKAMHVGHLRSSIIGDSLQRIHRFMGKNVISDIHLGDWGLPIGMIIMYLENSYPIFKKEKVNEDDLNIITIELLEKIYPIAAEICKNDRLARQKAQQITTELQNGNEKYYTIWEQITKVSIKSLKSNYEKMDIHFDLWYGESHVNKLIENLISKLKNEKHVYLSDGALISDTSFDAPIIFVTSEGSVTYAMTDVATIYDRVNNIKPNRIIYVVDKRQSLHFKQVFEFVKKSSICSNTYLEHVEFGTLNGIDGKPFKTRDGGVMKLEDLISMTKDKVIEKMQNRENINHIYEKASIIALAALKFADLSKYRLTDYVFDIDSFTEFNGKTGPYLIYTCVRIKSILKKAKCNGYKIGNVNDAIYIKEVRALLLCLINFYHTIKKSSIENAPHYLCEYIYLLAQSFSCMYTNLEILSNSNITIRSALLSVCEIVLINLEKSLSLLGIDSTAIDSM